MRGIDLMSVDQCHVVGKSDDSRPVGTSAAGREDAGTVDVAIKLEDPEIAEGSGSGSAGRRRRGRPPKTQAKSTPISPPAPSLLRKGREEEDVCFICFDGGSLVLCDRRGCPKAYHPACIKRDEAFFRSRAKWNCGWHICSSCQKDSYYMCYTCPYSVCKKCVRKADYSSVRGSKGFCGICMKTIFLIENAVEGDKEKVQVDFDDRSSWEYLFKIYWLSLKDKESLSLDELIEAKNPWKAACAVPSKAKMLPELCDHSTNKVCWSDNSCGDLVGNRAKRKKPKTEMTLINKLDSLNSSNPSGDRTLLLPNGAKWATNELLEFVAHMKNGDTSVLSKYDVQTLVLEYAKRNNLNDPFQNCQIICDSKLMGLFGKERVGYLEMLKLLGSHFLIQEKSPAANAASRNVVEAVNFKIETETNYDSLNRSTWNLRRESQVLDSPNIQVGPTSFVCSNLTVVRSESSVNFSKELPQVHASRMNEQINGLETNRIWQYQDPTGKNQGPFSMLNLRQWSTTGYFPPDWRIWRVNEKQEDSILLTDALAGRCHKAGPTLQNGTLPAKEVTTTSNDCNVSANAVKLDSKRLDVSPNSVSTEVSVISSGNSVITGNSVASNKSANSSSHTVPLDFALSSERQAGSSFSLWDKSKDDNSMPGQGQVSCSLSLAMFSGNSNDSQPHKRWSTGQSEAYGNSVKNANNQKGIGISCITDKQGDAGGNSIQSCGQNWKGSTANSISTIWDSSSGFASLADNQEIDFLDLLSPTFKSTLVPTSSDWQPIVADLNECDESVSDLLAEVEAMESLKEGLPSPTSAFGGTAELTRVSENDCFSPREGLSPALDINKGDAMSSTNDLQLPLRSTVMD